MKYYEITLSEANKIGYYKVTSQKHIDPKAGRLKNGNFVIPEDGLYGLTEINGVQLGSKPLKKVALNELIKDETL